MGRRWILVACLLVAGLLVWALTPAREPTAASVELGQPESHPGTDAGPGGEVAPAAPSRPESSDVAARSASAEIADRTSAESEARAPEPKPIILRLVDDATGEAAPRLRVRLVRGDRTLAELETDATGSVRSVEPVALGAWTLELLGNIEPRDLLQTKAQRPETKLELVHASEAPHEVRIPCGPTFHFDGSLPAGLAAADFEVQLASADPRKAFDKLLTDLRHDERLWARFTPLAKLASGGPPWRVTVRSRDGLWRSVVDVDALTGIRRAALALVFDAGARVHGKLLGPDGAPLAKEWVRFDREGAAFDDPTNRPLLVLTDATGEYDQRWLPPAAYAIRVEVEKLAPLARRIDVLAGTTQTLDLRLEASAIPADGVLSGRVTSDTGTYAGKVTARLVRKEGDRTLHTLRVAFDGPEGARVGTFRFEALLPGDYEVDLAVADGTWHAPRGLVAAPGTEPVEFRVLDRIPMRAIAFDVRGAQGEPVADARIVVRSPRDDVPSGEDARYLTSKRATGRVPAAGGFTWIVVAPGHKARGGTERDLDETGTVRVMLDAGYGLEIEVHTADRKPLEGVALTADGVDVGRTDARGRALLALERAPKALLAALDGWRASGGDVDPTTGAFRDFLPWLGIEMSPAPK